MQPATLDAILTILALVGVAVLVLLTQRLLTRSSVPGPEPEAVPVRVAVTPSTDPLSQRATR